MKIELVKNDAGNTVGWQIIAETKQDKLRLGSMRNMLFFGFGDSVVEYDGWRADPKDKKYVQSLHFATKKHIKETDAKLLKDK